MLTFNHTLAEQLVQRVQQDCLTIENLVEQIEAMSKECKDVLFSLDYSLRTIGQHTHSLQPKTLLDCAHHAAWGIFFSEYDLYSCLIGREYNEAVKRYLFCNTQKRDYYNDIKELVPFTSDNAQAFFDEIIRDTPEKRAKVMKEFLGSCGTEWRKQPKQVAKKMTLRGFETYGGNSQEFGLFLRLACWLHGVEFSWDKFWTEARNNTRIDGSQFELQHGLPVTAERHANGNTTLRINDAKLITALNRFIPE